MCQNAGFDDAHPYVDARLPTGERLHAVLQPISRHGTAISVRIPARRTFGLDELVAAGTIPSELAGLLADVVASSLSMLICGGTGSGNPTRRQDTLWVVRPRTAARTARCLLNSPYLLADGGRNVPLVAWRRR